MLYAIAVGLKRWLVVGCLVQVTWMWLGVLVHALYYFLGRCPLL